MSEKFSESNIYRARECVASGMELSREWVKRYDDNFKELKYLQQKVKNKREGLEFMYSRSNPQAVRSINRSYESGQIYLLETFDAIDEIETRIHALMREQEEMMAFVDRSVDRDCALVIRSYHELGMNFSQIGKLYHMGRSTANRRYWSGMEALERALERSARLAA